MRRQVDRRFFTRWVGWGVPPFFFGSAIVAFVGGGVPLGGVHLAIMLAWMLETAMTTCRRCGFYGTGHCGLPGRVTPLFFRRLPPGTVSARRIRLHAYIDFAMIAYINALYASCCPWLFPPVAIGSAVTLAIVYRDKRFHGLLYRLRREQGGPRIALPVLTQAVAARPPRSA